jgi:hypothetical protein
MHTPALLPMQYWSPPEAHAQALPMLYYDPTYGQYVFPQSPQPQYHPHFQPPPPPARFPYSQLHPQAPPFVPSGLKPHPFEPPAPSDPQLDPLAHALRRTMPKVRPRHAPGERRSAAPASDVMDTSNMSDKFVYVCALFSSPPPDSPRPGARRPPRCVCGHPQGGV